MNMHKMAAGLLAGIMMVAPLGVLAEEAEESLPIEQYLQVTMGQELSADTTKSFTLEGDMKDVDCSLIKVSVEEVFYDGEYESLYTAVTAVPASDDVMIKPADASNDDNVCGNWGENLNTDTRTFLGAAKEDGKRLISVYAYPKEFEEEGSYSLDHLQLADGNPLLLSSCGGTLNDNTISLTFTIQLYEVDLETGESSLVGTYEIPVTATVK